MTPVEAELEMRRLKRRCQDLGHLGNENEPLGGRETLWKDMPCRQCLVNYLEQTIPEPSYAAKQ